MRKPSVCLLLNTLLLFSFTIRGKVKRARSYKKMNIMLARSPLSVLMLSPDIKKKDAYWQQLRDTQVMYKSLSDDDFYKAADLHFIEAKADKDFGVASRRFDVTDMPKFLLFQGREPMIATLAGFVYRDQLKNFIDRNLKTQLKQRIQEKQKTQQRKLEQAKINAYNHAYRWGPYWGPYWAYGYWPYWQGPYFNYGWYW